MTKSKDDLLDHMLDHYQVDLTDQRLSRLSDKITMQVMTQQSTLFGAMNMSQMLSMALGVCVIALGLGGLALSQLTGDTQAYEIANAYMYGRF